MGSVTILRREPMPTGLNTVLRYREDGALIIYVADRLTAGQQRDAVRRAMLAARGRRPERRAS
jgi:hypothetical protein